MNAHKLSQSGRSSDKRTSSSVFDLIAEKYDAAVGSEEWGMGTPFLRKWILNHADGDVLEISAGTGRNLPHYSLGKIKSLTLCDLSMPMLEKAEDKYHEELRLAQRNAGVRVTFCLSDAHCMSTEPTSSKATTHATMGVQSLSVIRQRARKQQMQLQAQDGHISSPSSSSPEALPSSHGHEERSTGFFQRLIARPLSSRLQSSTNVTPSNAPTSGNEEPCCSSTPIASSYSWIKPWTWFRNQGGEPSGCACSSSGVLPHYAARCRSGTTESGLPLSRFPAASFDTVVDAFGLCSHEDPVQVLKEASRLCRPGGRILLLEHGRGHYAWLNDRLDDSAEKHHQKWGCWWNRDIADIVRQAGLKVEKLSRWHFGTTYICVARPDTSLSTAAQV
ncbi:hypothetical protein CEUSTIGMA_g1460.t1 [Chlamydomonas eustigma]|uniref:Methyltransferase type 11 domain-containing protein n=1 Tax=Chlamydomonas eustigma TaxID=1157962 RepID=A0A250WTY3_9CHLO|nr:hypothetical protein CEUSTIGMA_g1460.t1 [Chlamydomonas eustigma]|eukprot:GAX74010.1 hypothetical protein CEUSTIGMA_g1460.t1 [Chlamydomonas eustigma]